MAHFKITNPVTGRTVMLNSSDKNFDRLVLEACGSGMTEQSTRKAMASRRKLLELPFGEKMTLKAGTLQLDFVRLAKPTIN